MEAGGSHKHASSVACGREVATIKDSLWGWRGEVQQQTTSVVVLPGRRFIVAAVPHRGTLCTLLQWLLSSGLWVAFVSVTAREGSFVGAVVVFFCLSHACTLRHEYAPCTVVVLTKAASCLSDWPLTAEDQHHIALVSQIHDKVCSLFHVRSHGAT